MGFLRFIWHLPRNILAFLLKAYQLTFSPDHGVFIKWMFPGGYCKYTPSCSEYAHTCVKKYGVFKGGAKAFVRVVKCNPFSDGGIDLP